VKTGYFEEAQGVKSGTRLMCIPGFYAVLIMAAVMVWRGQDPIAVGTFLAASLAAIGAVKVGGAWQENRKEHNDEK